MDAGRFVQRYLSLAGSLVGQELFQGYARFLLQECDGLVLPTPIDRILDLLGLTRVDAVLPMRGFLAGDSVFVNSADRATVRRYTIAHEVMENFIESVQNTEPERLGRAVCGGWPDKEHWCESGAAELLLPESLVSAYAARPSLGSWRELAQLCQTSLTATVRRMLAFTPEACAFMILHKAHRKREIVPSRDGQCVLWGAPSDWDPPAPLRVRQSWGSERFGAYICNNESVAEGALPYQCFEIPAGALVQGYASLDMEYVKGTHWLECMGATFGGERVVMVLIRAERAI